MLKSIATGAAALMMTVTMSAAPAQARDYHRYHSYHRHSVHHARHVQSCRTGGTVIGAVAGGVLGNAITGHSAVGTVAGAGIGGLAGHRIARNNCGHPR